MFEKIFKDKYDFNKLEEEFTYMFEIIYPENRIVVDYGNMEDIVLLGKRRTHCGTEWSTDHYVDRGFNCVKKYDGIKDFRKLKELIEDNREGFVIHFNSTGSKCKIKGDEYIRLHKIMTQISTTSIWDVLANGGKMEDLLVNVPDEFYSKIKEVEQDLIYKFNLMDSIIKNEYKLIINSLGENHTDKDFALRVKDNPLSKMLFSYKNGKCYEKYLWRKIKPKYIAL